MRTFVLAGLLSAATLAGQTGPPTQSEIAHAYRSKCIDSAFIPGIRVEMRCIKDIRGWSVKFKRTGEERLAGVILKRYQAVARQGNTCAEYRIEDRIVLGPPNPQVRLRPRLTVEPEGVVACR